MKRLPRRPMIAIFIAGMLMSLAMFPSRALAFEHVDSMFDLNLEDCGPDASTFEWDCDTSSLSESIRRFSRATAESALRRAQSAARLRQPNGLFQSGPSGCTFERRTFAGGVWVTVTCNEFRQSGSSLGGSTVVMSSTLSSTSIMSGR